jgi:hypothetical protein
MSAEKSPIWWTYDHAPTRKVVVASLVVSWFLAVVLLYSEIVKVLAARPWWEDLIVALATVAVPVLALYELKHSAEANELRREENRLQERIGQLMAEHAAERNRLLEQIASNTQRAVTQAERNAATLRRHIGACVSVTEGQGGWPSTPLVAEVSDANIVTLFSPSAGSNPQAWCVQVDCGELEQPKRVRNGWKSSPAFHLVTLTETLTEVAKNTPILPNAT